MQLGVYAPARSPRIQRTWEERKHIGYKEHEKNKEPAWNTIAKNQLFSASHAGNKLKTTQTNYKTTKQWRSKGCGRHLYRCGNFARKYISIVPIGAPMYIWPQAAIHTAPPLQFRKELPRNLHGTQCHAGYQQPIDETLHSDNHLQW